MCSILIPSAACKSIGDYRLLGSRYPPVLSPSPRSRNNITIVFALYSQSTSFKTSTLVMLSGQLNCGGSHWPRAG